MNVYVLDSGVDASHCHFRDTPMIVNLDPSYPDTSGSHGTHVAGTLLGNRYGVAKGLSLFEYNVCRLEGGSCGFGDIGNGMDAVIAHMASQDIGTRGVINLSIGAPFRDEFLDQWWLDYFDALANAGVVPVVAAGNNGVDACTTIPAFAENAITVGAIKRDFDYPWWTNYGDTCVNVFAPGKDITSGVLGGDCVYESWQGTSMAAPYVAGVVALKLIENPNLSVDQCIDNFNSGLWTHTLPTCKGGTECRRVVHQCIDPPTPTPPLTTSTEPITCMCNPFLMNAKAIRRCARRKNMGACLRKGKCKWVCQ